MSRRGAIVTVLATELSQAIAADEADFGGFDISGGLLGPAVSVWLRAKADYIIELQDRAPSSAAEGKAEGESQ